MNAQWLILIFLLVSLLATYRVKVTRRPCPCGTGTDHFEGSRRVANSIMERVIVNRYSLRLPEPDVSRQAFLFDNARTLRHNATYILKRLRRRKISGGNPTGRQGRRLRAWPGRNRQVRS